MNLLWRIWLPACTLLFISAFCGLYWGWHHVIKRQHRFVITIPSYNNSQWYKKNLESVLMQDYPHYRVIYVDDASTDNTYELVKEFINKHKVQNKFTLLRNKKNHKQLYNLYRMIHMCREDEIIVNLDGDDWLANNNVLSQLNNIYQDENIWLTYSQFRHWPSNQPGWSRPIPNAVIQKNNFREFGFYSPHLRTYQAWLAQKIKLCDLISPISDCQGKFYSEPGDMPLMFPMFEMAGRHFKFIDDVLLIYNIKTPLNDFKIHHQEQQIIAEHLRWQPKYSPLKSNRSAKLKREQLYGVSLIIFSYDRPLQLYACLESIKKHMRGLKELYVLYRASNERFEKAYRQVQKNFEKIKFVKQLTKQDFYPLLKKAIEQTQEKYLMFGVDDDIVLDDIDLTLCTDALHRTKALGFFLRLGKNITYCYMRDRAHTIPPLQKCLPKIRSFKPSMGTDDWWFIFSVDMTIYKRKFVSYWMHFARYFNSPGTFELNITRSMFTEQIRRSNIGLCFKTSKIINNAVNLAQTDYPKNRNGNLYTKYELLEKFEQGLKIDLSSFEKQKFNACHIAVSYGFIQR